MANVLQNSTFLFREVLRVHRLEHALSQAVQIAGTR